MPSGTGGLDPQVAFKVINDAVTGYANDLLNHVASIPGAVKAGVTVLLGTHSLQFQKGAVWQGSRRAIQQAHMILEEGHQSENDPEEDDPLDPLVAALEERKALDQGLASQRLASHGNLKAVRNHAGFQVL